MTISKLFKAKKGQFYILISLLLVAYAYGLARAEVPVALPKDTFQVLREGYISEGGHVVNNAVYEGANVTGRFAGFTTDYIAFAKSVEPSFRLAYLLKSGDELVIGNQLGTAINVTAGSSSYLVRSNSVLAIPVSGVKLAAFGAVYDFSFSEDNIQLKVLFRSSDKLATRIFVAG